MILEDMFNGRFYPSEKVLTDTLIYKQAVLTCENLMNTLSERLPEKEKN